MKNNKISGFQWAMTIFVFFVITMALSIILRDYQATVGIKHFVFEITDIAPFVAAVICIVVFKHKKIQLAGLKFTIGSKVIERILLALILPLIIFMIGMYSFNTFADSFILLQASDLSVPITQILIGHIVMAFLVEFGFRSYLQNILETKMNTFFASIIIALMYSIFTANTTYGSQFAIYNFIYSFAFSMIISELIRATRGRTIYIATIFHASMTFGLVFLFSEELGDLFSMKVIALSTALVAVVFILLSLLIRFIVYMTTKRSLEEVEPNNYFDHVDDSDDENTNHQQDNSNVLGDNTTDNTKTDMSDNKSHDDSNHTTTDTSSSDNQHEDLKSSAPYKDDRHSATVTDAEEEIKDINNHNNHRR
ncbi:CPBP family intramembrane glutamic endopeptidase [Staphylococcus simiae]|uniref:CAAX prenyl protease 2/Lysostaphin resistance protein A-like domain-containing protein n=1 Tax=Staphylococcus simiae CCM 7213 = CCUG 51256 TaxID=911238 RepID=G5JHH2_9STAP|nr:CPBP family intramembrane glutamic endopeptidase [Staphylococcus simiae]EHJ08359.1 hypothetical protein SS7213T_04505 [Staphylococcus simiae CCM 7213 = CCUG 51256]SNV80062.1 Lysostaphin resistance protein A, lyrA [Staphylococcus simiae]